MLPCAALRFSRACGCRRACRHVQCANRLPSALMLRNAGLRLRLCKGAWNFQGADGPAACWWSYRTGGSRNVPGRLRRRARCLYNAQVATAQQFKIASTSSGPPCYRAGRAALLCANGSSSKGFLPATREITPLTEEIRCQPSVNQRKHFLKIAP